MKLLVEDNDDTRMIRAAMLMYAGLASSSAGAARGPFVTRRKMAPT